MNVNSKTGQLPFVANCFALDDRSKPQEFIENRGRRTTLGHPRDHFADKGKVSRSLHRSRTIEITITKTSLPRTPSSSMVEFRIAWLSVDHLLGRLACEDSSVITRTRLIDAIRPMIRKGSQTRTPERNDTRSV